MYGKPHGVVVTSEANSGKFHAANEVRQGEIYGKGTLWEEKAPLDDNKIINYTMKERFASYDNFYTARVVKTNEAWYMRDGELGTLGDDNWKDFQ